MDFRCPYCSAVNSFPSSNVDAVADCVACQNTFIVPRGGEGVGRRLPFPIETSQTRIRQFQAGDWEDLLTFAFNTEEEAQDWVHNRSAIRLTFTQEFMLGIEHKESGKIVGQLGIKFLGDTRKQVEVSIDTADASRELKPEVIGAALELCFQDFHVHRVCAQCFADDEDSSRVFQAVGMKKEAEFRKNVLHGTEWRSTCWFAMLEEEYLQP